MKLQMYAHAYGLMNKDDKHSLCILYSMYCIHSWLPNCVNGLILVDDLFLLKNSYIFIYEFIGLPLPQCRIYNHLL